jgi:predicted MFS family arabinose efflux permease
LIHATGAGEPARLYTGPLGLLLAVTFLGFVHNMLLQPVLPLLVLDRGGDATLVGLVVAAFSFPSVLLRPVFGRLVDEWKHGRVFLAGVLGLALSSFAYLVPSLAFILGVRLLHGISWAAFNTAGHTALARLAPTARRGEASGVFNLMPGLAQFVGPGLGLAILSASGFDWPFVAAGVAALAAVAIVASGRLRLPSTPAHRPTASGRAIDAFLEPGAVLPMVLELLFTTSATLFLVYPPVFAAREGIPIADLALYYPIYGGTLVTSRFLLRRAMDQLDRGRIVALGATVAAVSLAIAAAIPTLIGLTIAGALYGFAASFTSPTLMAAAIDRSEPRRIGAAMATYSLGYQLAIGVGAAIWGLVIDRLGYPAPYVLAALSQLAVLGLVATVWRRRARGGFDS